MDKANIVVSATHFQGSVLKTYFNSWKKDDGLLNKRLC